MRGHLEQRGKNVWRAKVFLGRDDGTGRKRYLTRAVHGTKREAEDVLTQLLGESRGASVGAATGRCRRALGPMDRYQRRPPVSDDPARLPPAHGPSDPPRFGERKVRNLRPAEIDAFYARLCALAAKLGAQ